MKILIFYIKLYPEELIFKIQGGNFQVVREGQGFKNLSQKFFKC